MIYKKLLFVLYALLFFMLILTVQLFSLDQGNASWYGDDFHGKLTASGELFDMNDYTAAHRDYEFGTKVKVTNIANKKSVIVRINDRGPYVEDRIIDLSKRAFTEIASIEEGIITVTVEVVDKPEENADNKNNNDDLIKNDENDLTVIDDVLDKDSENNNDVEDNNIKDPIKDDTKVEIEDDDMVEDNKGDKTNEKTNTIADTTLYRLQFGAFVERENSIKLSKGLIKLDIRVKIYKVKYKSGKILYKVISEDIYEGIEKAREIVKLYSTKGIECFPIESKF